MKLILGSLTYPLANGVTNSINVTVDGLVAAGHEALIVGPDYDTGAVRVEHRPVASSRISELASKPLGNGERFFSVKAVGQIQKIVTEFEPDAFWLHTVTWAPNIFEVFMQRTNCPCVLTYHTMIDHYGKAYAGQIGEQHMTTRSKEVAQNMDAVIAPSQFIADRLKAWNVTTPITVIPTGVGAVLGAYTKKELADKYGFSPERKILLSVGRVVREKNVGVLLAALKEAVRVRDDIILLLVGPGSLSDFGKEATALGLNNHVIMTDQVDPTEARRMYSGADLFVFASQTETQGLVFGEAMSVGLPIAALDSSIRPEFYPEDVAVVAKNEADLAAGIVELLSNKARCEQLRTSGLKFFKDHLSLQTMASKQIALFEDLLSGQ